MILPTQTQKVLLKARALITRVKNKREVSDVLQTTKLNNL